MTTISEAVVLMAGTGSRLAKAGSRIPKPLTSVLGRPLISYLFDALSEAGVRTVHGVVGYESGFLIEQVRPIVPAGLTLRFIENADWRKQNGISVLAAAEQVKSPFVLTMSDHLFDSGLLEMLLDRADEHRLNLAIDRKIESIVDIDDAMKVQTKGDRVVAIGKNLETYDAIDTGLFVANAELFDYLKAARNGGDCSLADGVRLMAEKGRVHAIDIGNAWWQDVDTPQTLLAAEKHLRLRLSNAGLASTGSHTER
ncbi:MAG TPA: NTP transferase domain-containing protein [Chthoniobacterales bacterium]|jgi:1L-myo-inositol 1-phosphate cytidylyltransferase